MTPRSTFRALLPAIVLAPLAACTDVPAHEARPNVATPHDLTAFSGSTPAQAVTGIQSLGYDLVRVDGAAGYWLNAYTEACAQIVTSEGVYTSVAMLPTNDCRTA